MKISRGIVLNLFQFDFSYSSSIITLSSSFILGLSALKKNHLWLLSWDVIFHKSTQSKIFFFLSSLLPEFTSTYFQPILFSSCVAASMHHFCFYELFILNIGQQPINLTSVFIKLLVECFSAIFKNIAHALYKQKLSAKWDEMFICEKTVPPKWGPSFRKEGSLLSVRIFFHINRIWFFNKILL